MSNKATVASVRKGLSDANSSNKDNAKIVAEIVVQLNKFYSGKRPLFVFCNKTGKKCAMTAKAYFAKKLAEYGGTIEKLFFTYSGRSSSKPAVVNKAARVIKKAVAKAGKVVVSKVPSLTVASWVVKFGKGEDNDVVRTEFKAGKKLVVVRDFYEATGETKYIKGNKNTLVSL